MEKKRLSRGSIVQVSGFTSEYMGPLDADIPQQTLRPCHGYMKAELLWLYVVIPKAAAGCRRLVVGEQRRI